MFTGIVEEQGSVTAVDDANGGKRLVIEANMTLKDTKVDDSICVSGVCLTVVSIDASCMTFDIVPETLRRSTLGSVAPGTRVNLERAMAGSQRFGGHYVQGHVDTTATVSARHVDGNATDLTFDFPEASRNLVTEKGFITVDGVSLTVTHTTAFSFGVTLVPHTQERVTLGRCQPGDQVNLEFDVFAKYVQRAVDERLTRLEQELADLRRYLSLR